MKKLITLILLVVLISTLTNAQGWKNDGAWPSADSTNFGGTHGVVVDADGKVWVSSYFKDVEFIDGTDTTLASAIKVFNADGSEVSFSPIYIVDINGTPDTINGNCRGLNLDENGNIIFVQSGPSKMIKLDYTSGNGISSALIPESGSSPTAPSVSDDGTIYVGPVVGGDGKQIATYDTDLNYLGSAVDGPPAIARTLEVTADGLTLYWMPFTAGKTYVYTRADEFSAFDLSDSIHIGMSIESSTWHPVTGELWVSNDVARGSDITKGNLYYYGYDVESRTFTDALNWDSPEDGEFARGIAFAPDGNTAYIGTFSNTTSRLQKVVVDELASPLAPVANNAPWNYEGAFPDTSYKGGTHGVVVDAEGKVWVSSYFKDVPLVDGTDTVLTSAILVFNEDGTETSFSPIFVVSTGGGFTVDTLNGNCRGLNLDENGNILYVQSGPSKMLKIDYTNGEGIARALIPESGSSPTAPSVSDDGTIYVGPVVGGDGKQIATYDTDLNYLGSAVDGPPAIARTLEVTADGLTLYWMPFTAQKTFIYKRADEFSAFELADSAHFGMSIESSTWHPVTGQLWVSNDAGRGNDITKGNLFYYAYDVESKTFTEALSWDSPEDGEFARGIAFNSDGTDAYIGTFSTGTPRLQKLSMVVDGVEVISSEVPNGYELSQNYPNPFNPSTIINFSIPNSGLVTIRVFDILGQEVAELINEVKSAGTYQVDFNAANLSTGMYVYRITSGKFNATRKMMLVK